jgi:23S rRNA pseudouridine2605 synthase
MQERLQKYLAAAGIGSRRSCEEWIKEGRASVNGKVVTELGTKIDTETDKIQFDGRRVQAPLKNYYIALHKPRGVVCSRSDPHAGKLVTEFVDLQSKPMLRPVGRLDCDSEGLIFLTDDGDFLYKLTHPKHHVAKTYRVSIRGVPSSDKLRAITRGVMLEDGMTKPAENVRVLRSNTEADGSGRSEIELTIYEGKNRQVRRMFSTLGHPVIKLVRKSIGGINLKGLASGAWRHLTPKEIETLMSDIPEPVKLKTKKPIIQENIESWPTEQQPSTPAKELSLPSSPKPRRPSLQVTSLNSRKKDSTTD